MARKVTGMIGRLGGFETLMERRLNASGEMERKVMMLGWGWKGIDEEIKHGEMSDEKIKEMVKRNKEIRGRRRMNDTREWIGIVVSRYPGWMYIRACRCARAGLNPAKLTYYPCIPDDISVSMEHIWLIIVISNYYLVITVIVPSAMILWTDSNKDNMEFM